YRVLGGTLTIGVLVAFMQYSVRGFRPIQDLGEKYNILQSAMASAERIFKLLDTPAAIKAPVNPVSLPAGEARVEFQDVWFAYQNEEWVLKDISFTIEPGESVAL